MSTIGAGGLPLIPLTGSVAGLAGQQKVAAGNQQAAEAAERKFQLDQQAATEKAVGDVGDPDAAGDRDADGREPWRFIGRHGVDGHSSGGQGGPLPKDPDGDRGGQLDLEA
jgi:ABC-type Na+ efflux pump permease subunit